MEHMRRYGNRKIKVNKQKLIDKIKENKENHVNEYNKAVEAYKKEAKRQLDDLLVKLGEGNLDIELDLIKPVNASDSYDKILEMFEWEVEVEVELEQNEFIQYVQDETDFAITAKLSNATYLVN